MEDGEAIEIAHRASRPDGDSTTVIELGGAGVISDRDYRVTDVPLRGFWSYYAELLGIEPAGAVRRRKPPRAVRRATVSRCTIFSSAMGL